MLQQSTSRLSRVATGPLVTGGGMGFTAIATASGWSSGKTVMFPLPCLVHRYPSSDRLMGLVVRPRATVAARGRPVRRVLKEKLSWNWLSWCYVKYFNVDFGWSFNPFYPIEGWVRISS